MAHEQHLKSVPSPFSSPQRGEGWGEGDVSFLSFLQKQESRFLCGSLFFARASLDSRSPIKDFEDKVRGNDNLNLFWPERAPQAPRCARGQGAQY